MDDPLMKFGRNLGPYRIESYLGRGGMGEVCLAVDERLGRRVAIKQLRSDLAPAPDVRERFRREARAVARLNHPSILQIYDVLENDDQDCIVMEYVEGVDLRELLGGRPLEIPLALSLGTDVAEGLEHAHEEGLVHRDLKASNVIVTPDGRAKILDFGLARALTGEDASSGGGIAGTPHAMSPEQALGDPIDRRSDYFSFGSLLYQMFSGKSPFRAETSLKTLQRVIHEDPPALDELRDDLPAGISETVAQLLEKDPVRRPASLRRVVLDLQRAREGDAAGAVSRSTLQRLAEMSTASRFESATPALPSPELSTNPTKGGSARGVRRFGFAAMILLVVLAAGWYVADQRSQAMQRERQSQELIDFLLGDFREQLQESGKLDLLDEVDEQALEYFAAVPASDLAPDELRIRSKALHQLGQTRMARGEFDEAAEAMRQALESAQAYVEREPDDEEGLFELGQAHFWIGHLHWQQRETDSALEHFTGYLRIARELTERDPNNSTWRKEEAYAHSNLASLSEERGELEQAALALETSARVFEGLLLGTPDDIDLLTGLATVYAKLGKVLRRCGELVTATVRFQAHLDLMRRVNAMRPDDLETLRLLGIAQGHLGDVLYLRGRLDEAIELYRDELFIAERLTEQEPANHLWLSEEALRRGKFAGALLLKGVDMESDIVVEKHLNRQRAILEMLLLGRPEHRLWRHLRALEYLTRAQLLHSREADQGAREQARMAAVKLRGLCKETKEIAVCYSLGRSLAMLGEIESTDFLRKEALQEGMLHARELVAQVRAPEYLTLLVRLRLALGEQDAIVPLLSELSAMGSMELDYYLGSGGKGI